MRNRRGNVEDILKILGKRIREERKRRGLTQEELAEKAGISNNFISYIESGKKSSSIKVVKRIADALGIHISELFKDVPAHCKKIDYTVKKFAYLIRDKNPKTKRLILKLCETVIKEN